MDGPEVLIVEDDERQRKILRKWLEHEDYSCTEAGNGLEGLQRFAEYNGAIKLIILDIKMPKMGGEEFLEKIRSESISSAPVVVCTGLSLEKIPNLDVFAVFEKPIDRQAFMKKVHKALYFGRKKTIFMSKVQQMGRAIQDHLVSL